MMRQLDLAILPTYIHIMIFVCFIRIAKEQQKYVFYPIAILIAATSTLKLLKLSDFYMLK